MTDGPVTSFLGGGQQLGCTEILSLKRQGKRRPPAPRPLLQGLWQMRGVRARPQHKMLKKICCPALQGQNAFNLFFKQLKMLCERLCPGVDEHRQWTSVWFVQAWRNRCSRESTA